MNTSSRRADGIQRISDEPRKLASEDSRESNATSFAEAVDRVAHLSTNEQGRRMSVAEIAARIGRSESYLGKATSKYDNAHPLRGDLIVPLTLATKNFAIVEHITRAVGGVFFPLPEVTADHLDVMDHTSKAIGEFGDVLAHIRKALEDRTVSIDEALRNEQEIDEAIAALAALRAVIRREAVKAVSA